MKKFNLFLTLALIATAVFAGYFLVGGNILSKSGTQTGTLLDKFGNTDASKTGVEEPQESGPLLLSSRQVVSPVNSSDKSSILFYEKNTGKVYEVDLKTKEESLVSDKELPGFISALWSPAKNASINSFKAGDKTVFKHFNILTGSELEMSKDIRSVSFSLDGSLLAYFSLPDAPVLTEDIESAPVQEPGKIFLSQPDGKYQKNILNTRVKNAIVTWPLLNKIALQTDYSEVLLLTEEGKLTKLFEESPGLELKWSPSGNKILFSAFRDRTTDRTPVLFLKDVESGLESPLNQEGSASLCSWSIDDVNVYCAVKKSPSVDEIYRLNSLDGTFTLIAEPYTTISDLFLSPLEDYLIYTNTDDSKLYKIKNGD